MDENLSEDEKQEKIERAKAEFEKNSEKYAEKYDENKFQKLIKKLPRKISEPFVTLYYVMGHPDISPGEKAICIGALGYVVFPLDIIPDAIPVVGWLDDLGIVAILLAKYQQYSQDERIKEKIANFYGD